MKTGLNDDEMEKIRAALEAVPAVEKAVLFGSRAMGLARSNSDVDILLYGRALQTRDVLRAASLLDATTLPYQFDLIRHDANNASLLEHIREYGKVIFQRQEMVARSKPSRKSEGMTGEWLDVQLGSVANITTGRLDSNASLQQGRYPFFTCSPETLRIDNYAFDCEAVLLAGNNANGVFAVKYYKGRFNAYQRTYVITSKDSSKLDVKYLFYHLTRLVHHFREYSIGTATKFLTLKILAPLSIPLPSLNEQRAIAHILGTLDDKIELNRRMNETLEAMARALFKAWFVDFEPVRAKLSGRWRRGQSLPGLPAHLYDLFPECLVDSELGEIPEGWRQSAIGSEVTVCGGSTPSTKNSKFWVNGYHCWATPKDLSALKFPVLLDTERKITDAGLAKISSGLLPAGTILLSSRAPIGYLAIAEIPTAINQGFIAMKCNRTLSNVFVLLWCRESMDLIMGNANGSTFQEISKSNFRPISVFVPTKPVLSHFDMLAGSLYRQIEDNERESYALTELRDTLLPKLITGELRIDTTEAMFEQGV